MNKHPNQLDVANALAEEKERKIAEERALAALRLQRKQRLQAMVIKRQRNLAYLKKVHLGGCYWMNTVLLTLPDIHTHIGNVIPKQRVESLFSLGISISKIIALNDGIPIVRAFSQLMEEWEYVHAGATMQSVKFVMAKNSTCIYPQMSPIEGLSDLSRPSVFKFNNVVVFEYLQLPHIPFELDYVEVILGLCVELSKLYEKLLHEECYNNQVVYDAIVRLDTRVKHHIINMVSKEITEVCSKKVKAGTRSLRKLAGSLLLSSTGKGTGGSSASLARAGTPPSQQRESFSGGMPPPVLAGSPAAAPSQAKRASSSSMAAPTTSSTSSASTIAPAGIAAQTLPGEGNSPGGVVVVDNPLKKDNL